jgi:hypothetical protein
MFKTLFDPGFGVIFCIERRRSPIRFQFRPNRVPSNWDPFEELRIDEVRRHAIVAENSVIQERAGGFRGVDVLHGNVNCPIPGAWTSSTFPKPSTCAAMTCSISNRRIANVRRQIVGVPGDDHRMRPG